MEWYASCMDWQNELKLQALRQVINSTNAASERLERRTFAYITLLSGLVVASITLDIKFSIPSSIMFSLLALCLTSLAVRVVHRSGIHKLELYRVLVSIEEKLGFYTDGAIGLNGTALPPEWLEVDKYEGLQYRWYHMLSILIVGIAAISAPWI